MLVLSRKSGQSITLAGNITIRVVHVRRGRVQLAIEAPKSVRIRRLELSSPSSARTGPSVIRTHAAATVCEPRHLRKRNSTNVDAV